MLDRRSFLGAAGALALAGCGPREERSDVVVIGAGLAGLSAARLLEATGARVIVLEAGPGIGGRVDTRKDAPGSPELGAADIGALYARVLDTAASLQIELAAWPQLPSAYSYHYAGRTFTAAEWPTLDINPFANELRNVAPSALGQRFAPQPNPLPDAGAWLQEEFAALDIPYGKYLAEAGAPAAALPLIGVGQQLATLDAESALWRLRNSKIGALGMAAAMQARQPARRYVPGGLARLPEAMAGSLQEGVVRLNQRVVAIGQDARGVTVRTASGTTVRAAFAVCTIPLPVLRQVAFDPPLPALVGEAVATIPYGAATSVVLHVEQPYWEADGLPPNLWTDSPLQRGFLNPSPVGEGHHLWIFSTGAADLAARGWTDAETGEYVLQELKRIRPSTAGRVSVAAIRSFTRDPLVLGTYAHRAPGQIRRFGNILSQPVGRLLFAGEHTADLASGMEAAMESGERAALAIATQRS